MPSTTRTPATRPIIMASILVTESQFAVMPTKPARMPFKAMDRSGFLNLYQAKAMAITPPMAAASVVFTAMSITVLVFSAPTMASWLPGLNPYQPIHKINTPRVEMVRL